MKTMALVRNRRMVMDVTCVIVALMGGFVAGAVDFNNNEPQAAVLVIIFFAGLLGFAQPRKAWRWAIIVGLGVPIVYLIATAFGYSAEELAGTRLVCVADRVDSGLLQHVLRGVTANGNFGRIMGRRSPSPSFKICVIRTLRVCVPKD